MPFTIHGKSPDKSTKPRPISFGGIFSKQPTIIAPLNGLGSPRRSMSTRVSETSNHPSRAASASPQPNHNGSDSGDEDNSSNSDIILPMDPSLVNLAAEKKQNRFSEFSFVPSYATSSVDGSRSVLEGLDNPSADDHPKEDGQTTSRFGSVSTSSEYPAGTSQKVKSPPPGNRSAKNSLANNDAESLSQVMEESFNPPFGFRGLERNRPSENGIMVAGESERGSELSIPLAKAVSRKDVPPTTSLTAFPAFPSPDKNTAPSPLRGGGTSQGGEDEAPDIVVNSPNTPTFAHVKDEPKSPRASKTLHVPFLHRFKPGSGKKKEEKRKSNRDSAATVETVKKIPHGQLDVGSFFDAGSSDGEEDRGHDADDEDDGGVGAAAAAGADKGAVFLGNATQASFRKPVLVQHRSGSMRTKDTSSQKVGLSDALSSGPSFDSRDGDVGRSDGSRTNVAGAVGTRPPLPLSKDEELQKLEDRRSGVIGWPASESAVDGPKTADGNLEIKYLEGDERVSGLWNGAANPFAPEPEPMMQHSTTDPGIGGLRPAVTGTPDPKAPADGLRSHPSIAVRPGPQPRSKSKVGFTLKTDTDAARGRKWEREDVISTPYPMGYEPEGKGGDWKKSSCGGGKGERQANLTVVIYKRGNGGGVPKVKKLKIPSVGHQISSPKGLGKPEKDGEAKVVMNQNFDDAKLARLLRGAHSSLKGTVMAKCGARTVCSVRLLGYTTWCQLATKRTKQQCFESDKERKDEESGFAEARLLELYRNPKAGTGKWEWWNWVRGLPENQAVVVEGEVRLEKIALELVEGWSAKRIIMAFSLVAVISVLACILWIFAGVNHVPAGGPLDSANGGGRTGPAQLNVSTDSVRSTGSDGGATTASHTASSASSTTRPSNDPSIIGVPSEGTQPAPGSAAATLSAILNGNGPAPTVVQRDTSSSAPSGGASPTVTSASSTGPTDERPDTSTTGGTGSRVGAGVTIGVLVLLIGWMFVGFWVALSWMTG